MITIIISSANNHLLENVTSNIDATIGVPYELIAVENRDGRMGMCEVYNRGIELAKYDFLCFMHEDLDIKTINWGLKVVDTFQNHRKLGVLGVAGNRYKSYAPSGWDTEGDEGGVKAINYIQSFKSASKSSTEVHVKPENSHIVNVACVDGMWFCVRKSIAISHRFDNELLKGFHGYDLDFCLNVGRTYDVSVTYEILMEHFSEGSFNKQWLEEILKVHEKWVSVLPIKTVALSDKQQLRFEKRAYKKLILMMVCFDYPKREIVKQLLKGRASGQISFGVFVKLSFYLLKS